MSIATEITRLQTLRNAIRTKLYNMGLVSATADLEDCKDAIEGITDQGTPAVSLDTSVPSVNVAAGYYHGGSVGISVKDLTGNDKITQNGTYNPPTGKVHGTVVVEVPAPSGYADVSGVTATPGDVASPALYVGSDGVLKPGTMPNNGTVAASINPMDGHDTMSYTIPAGRHSGSGTVTITSDIEDALKEI